MPRHDVTIYCPSAAGLFRRGHGRSAGMERQVLLLAHELAGRGFRVAIVVFPVGEREPEAARGLSLVERGARTDARGIRGTLVEAWRVVRALGAAGGAVVIVAGGTPVLGFIAVYCRLRRRRLVFAAHSDLDFELGPPQKIKRRRRLYRAGVRLADAVVVLTRYQRVLAEQVFPSLKPDRLVHIPSFAGGESAAAPGPPIEFLWAGRLHDVKQPLKYADLASSVPEAAFGLVAPVPPQPTPAALELMARLTESSERLPNLELIGPLPHAALQARLARAVALVNTSSHEGMPVTFLEAWSVGVPVLTLSVDPDGVIHDKGLGIAAGGSWERFVAGAKELWEGRLDRTDLAGRARSYVRDNHSLAAVGSQWQELLARLGCVASGSAPRGGVDP